MTKRWVVVRGFLGFAAVFLPGAVGAVVVAKTLSTYWGNDLQATVIVAAIGVALLLGLCELLLRQLRAARLEVEVLALPSLPNESTVDVVGAQLGSLLRARLEHAPAPTLGESIAPFLTGLLVMLGLLGTLLGLFQTVHGAGYALTSANDIDALRHNLAAPIAGLTRSFGCSAAGISASAMLGLSLALVRRRESQVLRAIYAYAAGPLRTQSPVRRQARAIEQLANQGNVLPAAATALEGVTQKLSELSNHVIELQSNAIKSQQGAFKELLESLRGELTRSASDSGEQLVSKLGPLLEQVATRSAEALTTQADAFASVARELKSELSQDASARRQETTEALQGLRTRLDDAERARASAHSAELEKLAQLASQSMGEAERREKEQAQRWQEQLSRLDTQLQAAQASEAERLRSLEQQLSLLRERDGERVTELDGLTTRVGTELTRLVTSLDAQLQARAGHEREHAGQTLEAASRLTAAATTLEAHADKQQRVLEQSAAEQRATFSQLVEQLPALFEQAARSSEASAQAAMAQLGAQLGQVAEQRFGQLSQLLSDEVNTRADTDQSIAERAHSAFQSVSQQGAALASLIERMEQLLPQLTVAAQAGAARTLERLNEQVEAQAARFAALESAISEGRAEQANSLATQLTEHAQQLEQKLSLTLDTVQDSAAIWQASSAEMHAVAKLFADSIERQREASDALIESLGDVEGAVERAGQHAAHDALSDQLSATQEVFAKQLQFQRELFEQLRSLRSSGASSNNRVGQGDLGEADVAV